MGLFELPGGAEDATFSFPVRICVALMRRGDRSFQCCIKDDRRSIAYVVMIQAANPDLFYHWTLGIK